MGKMDVVQLKNWINQCYMMISAKSDRIWCLLMDNCGGHELDVTLPNVRIVYLSPICTAKHQPLDPGVFVTSKIRYRCS